MKMDSHFRGNDRMAIDSRSPIRACPRPDRGTRTGFMEMTNVGARCIVPGVNKRQ